MIAVTFNITTGSGGAYDSSDTATYGKTVTGQNDRLPPCYLVGVEYIDVDMADTTDVTLTCAPPSGTAKTLLTLTNVTASGWYQPKVLAQDNVGADLTSEYTWQIVHGPLKVVVAQGGDTKTGKVIVYLAEV